MKNEVLIFHGSENEIVKPQYKYGNKENDFGEGFYCSTDIELAKEWACKENNDGYVNKYVINTDGLKIVNFLDSKYSIFNWLAILVKYRVFHKKNNFNSSVREFLMKYYIDTKSYDVIIGYRCDDSFFKYAKDFLNNRLTLKQLEKALLLGNLGIQYVIKSKKAFNRLKYIESEKVNKDEYYLKFISRDIKARKEYEKLFNKKIDINDKYIMDFIREEKK